jgi:hypothetical protein
VAACDLGESKLVLSLSDGFAVAATASLDFVGDESAVETRAMSSFR